MFVIESLATPVVWILLLLGAGLVLARFSRRKAAPKIGWSLVLLGTLLLGLLSFPPLANGLMYSLESRVPVPTEAELSDLDVIAVLGGGALSSGGFRQEADLGRRSYPRLWHGVRLFQRGDAEILAFCGGETRPGKECEAEIMKAIALQMGVPEDKILMERESTNTMENATGLAEILPGSAGRRIGLVTSATHMLRSWRTFRGQFPNDTIVPIPVYHRYDPDPWRLQGLAPSAAALEKSATALHEWIGLLWYSIRY